MKNYPLLLLLFCCTLFFTACSSDDDDTPSQEDMLMNKQWQITSLSASTLLGNVDLYAALDDCQKDNFVEFRANGVLMIDEGATKCNASDAQQTAGSWSLNGDVLLISGIGASFGLPLDELEVTITNLTTTRIDGEFSETISGFAIDGTVTLETM